MDFDYSWQENMGAYRVDSMVRKTFSPDAGDDLPPFDRWIVTASSIEYTDVIVMSSRDLPSAFDAIKKEARNRTKQREHERMYAATYYPGRTLSG